MLLILQRGSVFWAQVISDAYALQLMALGGWRGGHYLNGFGGGPGDAQHQNAGGSKRASDGFGSKQVCACLRVLLSVGAWLSWKGELV